METAGPEGPARDPDPIGGDRRDDPGTVGQERHDDRRARQDPGGIVDHPRVAALRLHHPPEAVERRPVVERRLGPRPGVLERAPLEPFDGARREPRRELTQATALLAAEDRDGLDDVERVADGVAERLRHVGDGGRRRPLRAAGQRQTGDRQRARLLGGLA